MDFYNLSRRELQALCKRNKIPANITNIAMADSLKALHIVEGLEDVLTAEKTSVDSPSKTGIKQTAPCTSCRTSTRQKTIKEERQTTQISTRTHGGTRRAMIKPDRENAAPVDMVRRKMESQLKEAADDENKGEQTPAAMTVVSLRKKGMTSVREGYSTRRSTRLLEKKMMGMNLDDDNEQVVLRDAQMVNELTSLEESVVFDKEMEVEGINQQKKPSGLVGKSYDSDEKHVVLLEDSVMGDKNEVDSLKVKLQQISEAFDEKDDVVDLVEKTDVPDEKPDVLLEDSVMGDKNDVDSLKVELQQIFEAFDEKIDVDDLKEKIDVDEKRAMFLEDIAMGDINDEDSFNVELQQISEALDENTDVVDLLEKTDVADQKHALLLEDSVMGDNFEEYSLKVELQRISKAFDKSKDHEDVDAGFLYENNDVSDEKHVVLPEVSVMADNYEEDSLKDELQQISEAFDESQDRKDIDAEVFHEKKGYLDSELTRIKSDMDGPADGLVLEKEEGFDSSFDQLEIDQEVTIVKDVNATSSVEETSNGEDFSPYQLEIEETAASDDTLPDSIYRDEADAEKRMIVAQISEGKSKGDVFISINDEVCEGLSEHLTSFNQLPSEETTAFETDSEDKSDIPIIVPEKENVISFEKCEQISYLPVISESKIVDLSLGKVGITKEHFETNSPQATEKTSNLPDISKEKVKAATAEMSMRQLKKMLKQLKITDKIHKNTDIKEEENNSKMGRARAALQPLSDNCLATSKRENVN